MKLIVLAEADVVSDRRNLFRVMIGGLGDRRERREKGRTD